MRLGLETEERTVESAAEIDHQGLQPGTAGGFEIGVGHVLQSRAVAASGEVRAAGTLGLPEVLSLEQGRLGFVIIGFAEVLFEAGFVKSCV